MSGGWATDLRAGRFEIAAVFNSRWGFTPWHPQAGQQMLLVMDINTWIVEVEVAACISVGAIIAFTLMLGHTLLMSRARK
jgi:hypothetical protein